MIAGKQAVLAALLAACARQEPAAGPPPIRYGLDACDRCRMVIDDPRFAAAARTVDGEALRFDDAGDLVALARERPDLLAAAWVQDFEGGGWQSVVTARFVRGELATPMGSGLVALADQAAAERFARDQRGRVLTWQDLMLARPEP